MLTTKQSRGGQQPSSLSNKQGSIIRVPSQVPTIQEALDGANAGDCLFLAPGVYNLLEPVSISKPVHIIGVNEVGTNAVIKFEPKTLSPAVAMLVVDAPDCRMKGVEFVYSHGSASTSTPDEISKVHGISVKNGASITFDECKFDFSVSGIRLHEKSYGTFLCVNGSASGTFMTVEGRAHLDRSDVGRGVEGVRIETTGSFTSEGTCVTDCDFGVRVIKHGVLKLDGCLISDCKTGVHINSPNPAPKPPMIKANEIIGCEIGVYVAGGRSHAEISKNFIHKCTHSGILIKGGSSEVRSNAVKDCLNYGIHVALGQPNVEGNVVQNCTTAGILIRHSRPTISANEIVGNQQDDTTTGILVYHPPLLAAQQQQAGDSSTAGGGKAQLSGSGGDTAAASKSQTPPSLPLGTTDANDGGDAIVVGDEANECNIPEYMENIDDAGQADPMVEGNVFGENSINIKVVRASGAYRKNELMPSSNNNFMAIGSQVVAIVATENQILGSSAAFTVYVSDGAQAKIFENSITNSKLSGIALRGSGPSTEVHSNVIDHCQDAIVAQGKAIARIGKNHTTLSVDVFSDSVATVLLD